MQLPKPYPKLTKIAPFKQKILSSTKMFNLIESSRTPQILSFMQSIKYLKLAKLFYQMKTLQLQQKFKNTQQIGLRQFQKHELMTFLMLLQYIYIQAKYLNEMTDLNLQGQRKILKKHKKVSKGLVSTPVLSHRKIGRFKKLNSKFIDQIQDYYVQKNTLQQQTKQRREYLRKTVQKPQATTLDGCLLGLWIGVSLCILIVLIVVVQINNLTLDTDTRFARDFPTWRGIAIFIFYIWVIGFDIYMYEEYKITHRLIFNFNDHHYSKSINIFKIAGLHTSLFLILFFLYVLQMAKIYDFPGVSNEYYAMICWGCFLFFFFIPLPIFNHKGRLYALKLVWQSIISPLKGVTFPVIWMTDQLVSMVTPVKDFAYTICYYKDVDFSKTDNPCKDSNIASVVLIVAVGALSYRMIQCMRQGYDKGEYFGTPFFFNTIKYGLSVITAVLSFQYKLGVQNTLPAWLVFAVISTIYSYIWDLKMDWNLLQKNDRHPFLRKYLTFQPTRNYYIIAIANFLMRLAWTLTLSPSIANIFGNAIIFTLITGMIQIFRRGIWNLLRVQKQHLVNCGDFRAVPDTTQIQNKLVKSQDENQMQILLLRFLKKFQNQRQLLKIQFLALIREKIVQKEQMMAKYNQQFQKAQLKQINQLMKQALKMDPQISEKIQKKNKKKNKKNKKKGQKESKIKLKQLKQDRD